MANSLSYIVVDTNVVFEGLTKRGGASGLIIEAWLDRQLTVHVSDALGYEYIAALSDRLSPHRWSIIRPALAGLLERAVFVHLNYRWQPASPDPGDEHVIDCAMNTGAVVATHNIRDFRAAQTGLGLRVLTPAQWVIQFIEQNETR